VSLHSLFLPEAVVLVHVIDDVDKRTGDKSAIYTTNGCH